MVKVEPCRVTLVELVAYWGEELMSEKKSLEGQINTLTFASSSWVEPLRQWLKMAVSLCETAKNAEPVALKQAFLQMEGLNLLLENKKARLLPRPEAHSPQENLWLALRAVKEKAAHSGDNSEKSLLLAHFYNQARTYFSANI